MKTRYVICIRPPRVSRLKFEQEYYKLKFHAGDDPFAFASLDSPRPPLQPVGQEDRIVSFPPHRPGTRRFLGLTGIRAAGNPLERNWIPCRGIINPLLFYAVMRAPEIWYGPSRKARVIEIKRRTW
ncbi:hypothetical protein KM043_014619 [Ampulex compressa]|nr:hypothetical protein KM043_014619 [Ampulex compressa]